MESELKLEEQQIQQAIQKLMEEEDRKKKRINNDKNLSSDDDEEEGHRLLSRLLSQLKKVRAGEKTERPETPFDAKEVSYGDGKVVDPPDAATENRVDVGSSVIDNEEIVRELGKVKRQNLITHCLLSALIVLTITWQMSEVSLILKLKDGMSHPFRSVSSLITGMLKGPNMKCKDGEKQSPSKQTIVDSSSLPGLKIPDLLRLELPAFDSSNDED